MNKDYQIRIEFEFDGSEEVYNFDSLTIAQHEFRETCAKLRREGHSDDVHVELIEVLEQERIEPEFQEG